MSDGLTPETDAAIISANGAWTFGLKETMQRLEHEVDPDTSHDHLLQGQPKPTGEQLAWVFSFLADLCQSERQSYGFVLQRMYGYPSREKLIAAGPGMFVTNTINCAIENPDVVKAVGECCT